MKLVFLILITVATAAVQSVPTTLSERRTVELLTNYVRDFGNGDNATLFVDWHVDSHGFRNAYWMERQTLLRFPCDFTDDAVVAPVLVTRALRYEIDVRPEGDRELATSNYLEEEFSFRRRVAQIQNGGDVLRLKPWALVAMHLDRRVAPTYHGDDNRHRHRHSLAQPAAVVATH